jgi:hypothetical protein
MPTSVLFDALHSKLPLADAELDSILEMLSCLLCGDRSLLTRAIDARIAIGDDAAWLKLLTAVADPIIDAISMQSLATIRQCVTPLIQGVDANPAQLLDGLIVMQRLLAEHDNGVDAIKSKRRSLLNIPDLAAHLIRLLHHPSSDRVQLTALKVLSRALELIPALMHACLRGRLINTENFGHFCSESMDRESDCAIYGVVYYINRESTIRPFYIDFLPLLVRILRSPHDDHHMARAQYYCLEIITRCMSEVGRPAVELLLQHDPIGLLIDFILVAPFSYGASRDSCVCDILAALLKNDIDDHGDDGVMLHPWMAQLVDSARGLAGLEGTHAQATAGRCG